MCGNKLIKWHAKQVIIGGDCHKKLLSKCQRDLTQRKSPSTAGSRINVLHIVKIKDKAKRWDCRLCERELAD